MPGYVSFTDGALPHDSIDKWDVAFEAIRDGKLSAGDFIGLGINVRNNKPPSLSLLCNRSFRAQEDSDEEDEEDYVEVTLKVKASMKFKASVVKTAKYAGLAARTSAGAGELSARVGKYVYVIHLCVTECVFFGRNGRVIQVVEEPGIGRRLRRRPRQLLRLREGNALPASPRHSPP